MVEKRDIPKCIADTLVALTLILPKVAPKKKVDIFISRDSRLYCQVEFSLSLQEEERDINGTCVEKLKDLLPSCNNICVWKFISPLEFDEVFQLFVDVVNRCTQLVNNG